MNYAGYDVATARVAGGSSMAPIAPRDIALQYSRMFCQQYELLTWLDTLEFSAISKLSEREFIRKQLEDIMHVGKEAFDIAHGQGATGAPTRDASQVDRSGRKVVVMYDTAFAHYWAQIKSLLYETASGKQAPNSASSQKTSDSSTSMGDVQRLPNDPMQALQKALPALRQAIASMPSQRRLDTRFGWTGGSALQGLNPMPDESDFGDV